MEEIIGGPYGPSSPDFSPSTEEELKKLSKNELKKMLRDEIKNIYYREEKTFFYKTVIGNKLKVGKIGWNSVEHFLSELIKKMDRDEKASALISSLEQKKFELTKLLLDNGAPANAWNNEALLRAAYLGNTEMIDLLIKKGGEKVMSSIGNSISQLVFFSMKEPIKHLLGYEPTISEKDRKSIITNISRCRDLEIVKMLVPEFVKYYAIDTHFTIQSQAVKKYLEGNMLE